MTLTEAAMPAMGIGSLQDALTKKILERNNKGVPSKPTQQAPSPQPPLPQQQQPIRSNSKQGKCMFFNKFVRLMDSNNSNRFSC